MRPFDLEAAKRGEPIVARNGRKATYVGHAPQANESHRVVAHIEGSAFPYAFSESGKIWSHQSDDDLFMAPRKRTVYVNLWADDANPWHKGRPGKIAYYHETEQEALDATCGYAAVAVAMPVEIEE